MIMKVVWTVFALLVLLSDGALALGITPANKILDFEPGVEKSVAYRIYNTEQKDFVAQLNITGALKDYITLDQSQITFTKDDKVKSFTLTIRIPEVVPTDASATISVIGVPKDASATLKLQASLGLNMPTGAVVGEPNIQSEAKSKTDKKENTPLLAIAAGILALLIIGNIVYFTYARWPARTIPMPGIKVEEPVQDAPVPPYIESVQPNRTEQDCVEQMPPAPEKQIVQAEEPMQEPTPQNIMESLNQRICFADGTPVSSVSEMIYFLENIDESTYSSFVNSRKNDIAVWTDLVLKEPRLAMRIYDAGTKYEVINAFNVHMIAIKQKEEEKRHAAELKAEIEKLRSELGF